ncbi:MAG: molybdenum cofactor biosynthesis protein MoaE, partial [Acidobacteria bacterium]|nr:molybdenum cofactor biosynthesis protein MoaE [Acidobacteriota bacterium]
MMRINVLFFGMLKDIVGQTEDHVILEEGASIGQLYEIYAARLPRLAKHSSSILFSRNRAFADRSELLQEGDEVAFLPPVSGGAPGRAEDSDGCSEPETVHRLTREPIDSRALVEELKRGKDGAVVVFEGIVRNHSKDQASGERATLYLEYESYEPMALEKMREITAEVKRDFPVDRVGIVHRLGRLEIGEACVVIVVTSGLRREAFEGCRYTIVRLKRIVRIWK